MASSVTTVRISKWLNLAIFFVLDFLIIFSITSLKVLYTNPFLDVSTENLELLGFVIKVEPDLLFTLVIFATTLLFRLILVTFSVRKTFKQDTLIKIYSSDQDIQVALHDSESLPDLDLDFLIDIVTNITKQVSYKIESAFVNISPIPYTFTLNSVPIPFKQRIMLVLNSNMMKIFRKQEAEAQIYHELGHVGTIDNIVRIIFTSPRLFLQLAYWYFYLYLGIGIANALISFNLITAITRTLFLFIVIVIFRLTEIISISFLKRSNRCVEHLADWVMVKHTGLETSINTLVKSGQRLEAIDAFYDEVVWLDSLYKDPFRKKDSRRLWQWFESNKLSKKVFINSILPIFPDNLINEDIARERAPYFFIKWKLQEFRNTYYLNLENEAIEKLAEDGQKALIKKRKQFLEELPEDERPSWLNRDETTLDWRTHDTDKDRHLDMEEIKTLVSTLKEKPDLHLFENELDMMAYERDHPTIRSRILFLWDNLKKNKNV